MCEACHFDLLPLVDLLERRERQPQSLSEKWVRNFAKDPGVSRAAAARMRALVSRYASEMADHLFDLRSGRITGDQAIERMTASMSRSTAKAYLNGKERQIGIKSVLSADDMAYLDRAREAEAAFVRRFVGQIVTDPPVLPPGRMPYGTRLNMYVRTLTGFENNAMVEYAPEDVLVRWTLGPAEHCDDCLSLEAMNPWTRDTLPTVPGAGDTSCRCMLHSGHKLTTRRGQIRMRDIRVGDEVLTHNRRWRRVHGIHLNRTEQSHSFAAIVTAEGLIGFTSDHSVWTDEGWKTAQEAATSGLRVLPGMRCRKAEESFAAVPKLCAHETRECRASDVRRVQCLRKTEIQAVVCAVVHSVSGESDSATIRGFADRGLQRSEARRPDVCVLLGRRQEENRLPLPLAVGAGIWSYSGRPCDSSSERRSSGRQDGKSGVEDCRATQRRSFQGTTEPSMDRRDADSQVRNVRQGIQSVRSSPWRKAKILLGGLSDSGISEARKTRTDHLCYMRQDVHSDIRLQNVAEVLFSKMFQRIKTEPASVLDVRELRRDVSGAVGPRPGAAVLLPKLPRYSRVCDSSMRLVRQNHQKAEIDGQATQFLLSDMLGKSPSEDEDPVLRLVREDIQQGYLEDRTVEVGQVLLLRSVLPPGSPLYDLTVEEDASFTVNGLVVHNSNCRCSLFYDRAPSKKVKAVGRPPSLPALFQLPKAPPGLRHPTGVERAGVEQLRQQMNFWRRKISEAGAAGDLPAKARAIKMRRQVNDRLIKFLRSNKLYSPPALSVGEVISGKVVDEKLAAELFARGLDGATISTLDQADIDRLLKRVASSGSALDAQIKKVLK